MANRIPNNSSRDSGTPTGDEATAHRHAMVGAERDRRSGLYVTLRQSQTAGASVLSESTSSTEQTLLAHILRAEIAKAVACGTWPSIIQTRSAGD